MEHHGLKLAIAAVAVFGLVAATHGRHPASFERSNRTARVVEVADGAAAMPGAWTGPPRRLRGPEPAELMEASASLLADRPTIALPTAARMVPRLSSTLAAPTPHGRTVEGDPIGDLIRGLDRGGEG